jgi:putative methionine-R-sulfoxide reductase with GAF domain
MLDGTRAEAIFPLSAGARVVGTLDVESGNAQAFTAERIRWLERCVEGLGVFWQDRSASR